RRDAMIVQTSATRPGMMSAPPRPPEVAPRSAAPTSVATNAAGKGRLEGLGTVLRSSRRRFRSRVWPYRDNADDPSRGRACRGQHEGPGASRGLGTGRVKAARVAAPGRMVACLA